MIAGPNGVGKTTMALELVNGNTPIDEFINADEIARGLSPRKPEGVSLMASKLMLLRLRELLKAGKSFAFETTGSGTNYVAYLKDAKEQGYEITSVFLWLSQVEEAIDRVAERVKQGGHNILENSIRRRYYSGLRNFVHV